MTSRPSSQEPMFPHKMWGFDQEKVLEYLDRLTNRLHIATRELEATRVENESLRAEHRRVPVEFQRMQAELQRSQAELKRTQAELREVRHELEEHEQGGGGVNDQIVEMFSQAQLIAESMVADVSRDAAERIEQARAHERKIVEQAVNAAGKHVHEYARSAQAQMHSIMESFAQEVDRLGVVVAPGDLPAAMDAVTDGAPGPATGAATAPVTGAAAGPATAPPSDGANVKKVNQRNGAPVARGEG